MSLLEASCSASRSRPRSLPHPRCLAVSHAVYDLLVLNRQELIGGDATRVTPNIHSRSEDRSGITYWRHRTGKCATRHRRCKPVGCVIRCCGRDRERSKFGLYMATTSIRDGTCIPRAVARGGPCTSQAMVCSLSSRSGLHPFLIPRTEGTGRYAYPSYGGQLPSGDISGR